MAETANIKMLDGATAPAISNVFVNNNCASCTFQVTGTYTSATVAAQGIVNLDSGAWVDLAVFDLSDLKLNDEGTGENGIYQLGIEGIPRVRFALTAVSGGSLTLVAQFGNAVVESLSREDYSWLVPPVSAYDLAVLGGYTGTIAEFEQDMGNSGTNATSAADSAEAAAQSAATAEAAAEYNSRLPVVEAMEAADRAAESAESAIGAAQDAEATAQSAVEAAQNAVSTAQDAVVTAENAVLTASGAAVAAVPNVVTNWLNANVAPADPDFILDSSLSIAGAAADAKAAGDAVAAVRDPLDAMARIQYEFTLKSYVDANGTITDPNDPSPNNYMSRTQRIPCEGGDLVVRNTQNSDSGGKHLVIYVAEFNGTVFQKRTEMLSRGSTLTIGDTTDNIILCFGRYASSQTFISQADIAAYFDMGVYRDTLSIPEFEEYIKNDSFYNRGNVIDLGYTAFSQCVLPGLYTFSTANLASISDEPPGLNAGGLLIVYNAGTVIWQEIHSTYYEFIRYGANGTWIDKHDYVRAAYSGAAGEDDSTESIDVFLQRGIDGKKVRYNMGHCVNASINANVWRITYLYSLAAHQTGGTQMTRKGEFECAVHLANRDDFSGGWVHGDEVDQSVTFLGDGKVMTAANVNGFYREFKIVRNSILYDPADHTTAIAEHGVEYIFTPEGLTVNQSVKWLIAATLTSCYLAMLPILKTFSTYRYDDTSFTVTENTQSSYSVTIPKATSVTEYINGIATTMSIGTYPTGLTGGDCALVTDNQGENYNKVYFVVCTSGSVTAGTLWKSSTRYLVK